MGEFIFELQIKVHSDCNLIYETGKVIAMEIARGITRLNTFKWVGGKRRRDEDE